MKFVWMFTLLAFCLSSAPAFATPCLDADDCPDSFMESLHKKTHKSSCDNCTACAHSFVVINFTKDAATNSYFSSQSFELSQNTKFISRVSPPLLKPPATA
jgi:hypothetical protein